MTKEEIIKFMKQVKGKKKIKPETLKAKSFDIKYDYNDEPPF